MKSSATRTALAAALAAAFALNVAVAQTTTTTTPEKKPAAAVDKTTVVNADKSVDYSDRNRMKTWSGDKERLAANLKTGASKADYMKIIADAGYTITAINSDKPDYLEYEVVKGGDSYEVKIDLDKKTNLGSKIDVDRNLWRAAATKEAMRTGKAVAATKALPDGSTYSDRTHTKNWTSGKEKLEKALGTGKDLAFYKSELKKMGYQVTATNDKEKDYVELEVVKGNDSYEIQINLDDKGMGKKVDVTSNMWQSDETDKALSSKKK